MDFLKNISDAGGGRITAFGVGMVFMALLWIWAFIEAFSRIMRVRPLSKTKPADAIAAPHVVTDRYMYDKAHTEDLPPEIAEVLRRQRGGRPHRPDAG
jgi:Na+-transporting methylmalonyl-CoA/oxaloacetate decarboxylase gamma subunit